MFCKQLLALFLWCHCYQIVLNPLFQFMIAIGLNGNHQAQNHHNHLHSHLHSLGNDPEWRIFGTNWLAPIRSRYYLGKQAVEEEEELLLEQERELEQQQQRQRQYHLNSLSNSPFRHSFGAILVAGTPIDIVANNVALTPGVEIILRCNIAGYPDEKFSWFRIRHYPIKGNHLVLAEDQQAGDEELKQSKENENKFSIQNNIIVLKSPTLADQGDYYCRVKNPRDDMESEKMIRVRARPYIYDFNLESSTFKSAIVDEGKSLKLPCNIIDDYAPDSALKVNWLMSKFEENDMNEVINGEDGIRMETYNSTSHALVIDRVTKDHRRFYKCSVTNGITENSKSILVRVRDKYTVIWPAVGIVIELVILIGVICVVENRRVEPDKVAYDRKAIQM